MWAVLLGILLVLAAAASSNAATITAIPRPAAASIYYAAPLVR
jgi:hypothetical protein